VRGLIILACGNLLKRDPLPGAAHDFRCRMKEGFNLLEQALREVAP